MVKLTALTSLLALAAPAAVLATPAPAPELITRNNGGKKCVSTPEAKQLINDFKSLFEKFDEKVAKRILTPDFTVYSASINFLIGQRGGPTSVGRDNFIKGSKQDQSTRPPGFLKKITVLDADHTCDKIYFRYQDNSDPAGIANVFGFDELILAYKDNRWQIKADYGEFNNAIVLFNAGLFPCNASNTPTPGT